MNNLTAETAKECAVKILALNLPAERLKQLCDRLCHEMWQSFQCKEMTHEDICNVEELMPEDYQPITFS